MQPTILINNHFNEYSLKLLYNVKVKFFCGLNMYKSAVTLFYGITENSFKCQVK